MGGRTAFTQNGSRLVVFALRVGGVMCYISGQPSFLDLSTRYMAHSPSFDALLLGNGGGRANFGLYLILGLRCDDTQSPRIGVITWRERSTYKGLHTASCILLLKLFRKGVTW